MQPKSVCGICRLVFTHIISTPLFPTLNHVSRPSKQCVFFIAWMCTLFLRAFRVSYIPSAFGNFFASCYLRVLIFAILLVGIFFTKFVFLFLTNFLLLHMRIKDKLN